MIHEQCLQMEPMTEYEVYSYKAFRKKYQDDIREVSRAALRTLDSQKVEVYIALLKDGKPHLSHLSDNEIVRIAQNIPLQQSEKPSSMLWCTGITVFIQKECLFKFRCLRTVLKFIIRAPFTEELR